uniref:SFRICE_036894 n=1 Tax=Spodoptera frugiperda TaxID=7108 RepID=A0A2H1X027_SPOFR
MGRDSELRELVRKRGNLRGRLTLFEKYINSLDKTNILEQQVVEIKLRVANTETIFSDFQEVQSEIEGLSDEPELLTQLEIRESIESQFYSSMSLAKTCICNKVLKNLRSLKNLGESTEHWDTLVIFLITTKLDPNTCQKWEDKKNTFEKDYKPKLDDIIEFLKNRSDVLDMLKAQGHKQNTDSPKRSIINSSQSQQMRSFVANKQLTRASTSATKSSRAFKCIMCDGSHALYSCITFLNLPVQDRLTFVQNKRNVICTNCLRTGHALDDCQFGPCKQCTQKHNSLIHIDNTASCNSLRFLPTLTHTDTPANNATDSAHANTSSLGPNSITSYHSKQAVQSNTLDQVLLSTALVEVCNNNNTYIVARALLDSGSQRCFVTESLCKKLHLPTIQSTLNISGIGNSVMCSEQSCDLVIRSRFNDFSRRLNCSVLPKITFCLPNSRLDFNSFQIPQNVKLADPDYYVPSEIDILIGADVFWDLLQVGLIRLPTGPYLQNTRLGWVISGTVLGNKAYSTNNQTSNNNIIYCSLSTSLEGQLKRFWELEEVDSGKSGNNNTYTEDDRLCEDLFTSTTIRDSEGRFAVRIPLRESADSLGDSYESAKNRFLSLERKLDRAPELKSIKQEPLGIYQLNTVTYGTASAPYLAMRCLRQLAFECDDELVSSNILNSFYCDDLIFSHDNKQELLTLCENINKTLLSGCFPLRKWSFNFDVSPSDSFTKSLSLDKNAQCKTLGLGWCNSSDELHFKTNLNIDVDVSQLTKRKILSFISQIYDPLGLLAPVIITTKILIQKLWLYKIGWDDPVSSDLACLFSKTVSSFQYLPQIRVPRHVTTKHVQYLQLHIFTDASQDAYGACAYIRSVSTSNEPVVKLLCAKSKVAPLKPVSIPRLELCGALVGARLYKKIIESINLTFNNTYFWTDSTIVLGWLRTHPIALKTFVQNRVVEINDLTSGCTWSHVSGVLNPADMLTRGVNLPELVHKDLWWNGPGFILDGNLEKYNLPDIPSDLPELKPDKVVGLHASCNSFPFDKFSSFVRMTRCVAYMLRFIHNTRHKTNHIQGALSVEELRRSTILLARLSQIDSFPDEWSKEFVSELQTRTKWQKNKGDLNENTLVLIKEENQPPLKWRLGRVLAVHTGKDGVSRVAKIRTASGEILRSFSKICPLPVDITPTENQVSRGGAC